MIERTPPTGCGKVSDLATRLTAGLILGLGLNPDLRLLIVIPTNDVREAESAGLAKADSSAKRQASE
jgi:hypothetical protein